MRSNLPILNYASRPEDSNLVLPQSAQLSTGNQWQDFHFETQQQPAHDTGDHLHQMHIVTMVTSGTPIDQIIDGRVQRNLVGHNNIFILPAGAVHRCSWSQNIEFAFVGLDPQLFAQVSEAVIDPDRIELMPHFATIADPLLQGILLTLKQETITNEPNASFIDLLKTTLVMHLLRRYGVQQVPLANCQHGLSRQKLKQVIDYMMAHLDQNLSLADLAKLIQMSPFHFARSFKASTGLAPHQFVIRARVERAKELLLQGSLGIADIAVEVGFANQSHLTRCFKRILGVTPRTLLDDRAMP